MLRHPCVASAFRKCVKKKARICDHFFLRLCCRVCVYNLPLNICIYIFDFDDTFVFRCFVLFPCVFLSSYYYYKNNTHFFTQMSSETNEPVNEQRDDEAAALFKSEFAKASFDHEK